MLGFYASTFTPENTVQIYDKIQRKLCFDTLRGGRSRCESIICKLYLNEINMETGVIVVDQRQWWWGEWWKWVWCGWQRQRSNYNSGYMNNI